MTGRPDSSGRCCAASPTQSTSARRSTIPPAPTTSSSERFQGIAGARLVRRFRVRAKPSFGARLRSRRPARYSRRPIVTARSKCSRVFGVSAVRASTVAASRQAARPTVGCSPRR
jgi:hypothetical protein